MTTQLATAAGKYSKKITFEDVTRGRGEMGGQTESWATFATRFASVEALSGREQMHADERYANVQWLVRVRYLSGITSAMRILYGTKYLQIEFTRDLGERQRELEIFCSEWVGKS